MFCDLTRNAWPNLIKDAKTKTNRAAWCLPFPCAWYCLHFSFCICVSVCVCFYISVLCFILSFNCRLLLIIFTFDYPRGFFGFGFTTFNWQIAALSCCIPQFLMAVPLYLLAPFFYPGPSTVVEPSPHSRHLLQLCGHGSKSVSLSVGRRNWRQVSRVSCENATVNLKSCFVIFYVKCAVVTNLQHFCFLKKLTCGHSCFCFCFGFFVRQISLFLWRWIRYRWSKAIRSKCFAFLK